MRQAASAQSMRRALACFTFDNMAEAAEGGARTRHTAATLRRLGYRYDASLGDDMRVGILAPDLAQIPFVWRAVDGFHYLRPEPADPTTVRIAWLRALERVARDGGLFLLI